MYISEMRGVKGTISLTRRVVSRARYTCWKRCGRYCWTVPHATRRSRGCEMRRVKGTISQTWRVVSGARYTCWKRCGRYCWTVPHATRRSRECAARLFRTRKRGEIARETCAEYFTILNYAHVMVCYETNSISQCQVPTI
jgi:hypothetical protein